MGTYFAYLFVIIYLIFVQEVARNPLLSLLVQSNFGLDMSSIIDLIDFATKFDPSRISELNEAALVVLDLVQCLRLDRVTGYVNESDFQDAALRYSIKSELLAGSYL